MNTLEIGLRTSREILFRQTLSCIYIAREKQLSKPVNKYSYCNECYVLAGLVLAEATSSEYEVLLRNKILSPFGMKNTGIEKIDQFIKQKAYIILYKALFFQKPKAINMDYREVP